jgi:hypothetical protein
MSFDRMLSSHIDRITMAVQHAGYVNAGTNTSNTVDRIEPP